MTLELRRKFPTFDKELTEPGACTTQPRLDGAQSHPFSLSGLLIAQPLDITQHYDDPLIVRQRGQPLLPHADGLSGEGRALRPDPPVREAGLVPALLDDHIQ